MRAVPHACRCGLAWSVGLVTRDQVLLAAKTAVAAGLARSAT
jgi:hypothetical protein